MNVESHLARTQNSQPGDLVSRDNCFFVVPSLSAVADTPGMDLVSADSEIPQTLVLPGCIGLKQWNVISFIK